MRKARYSEWRHGLSRKVSNVIPCNAARGPKDIGTTRADLLGGLNLLAVMGRVILVTDLGTAFADEVPEMRTGTGFVWPIG